MCPHYPFPKSHGNPKSMNKLALNEPAKISHKISCRISHKKCISETNSQPIFTYDPPNQSLEPPLQDKNILVKF